MSATRELEKGRQRYFRERRQEAIRRVKAYRAWIRSGCPSGPTVPALSTSHDFRIAEGAVR